MNCVSPYIMWTDEKIWQQYAPWEADKCDVFVNALLENLCNCIGGNNIL